ncbi:hypothetical protein FB45DRAFT_931975 [Roridomyces roridus]|uniref:Uncharacterized protein n=1 Tax=Roridomyces roridus TaxID=1738132 RepID=A0AAD7BE36_9AGAR|nr:hypothetical protein FB45DRAFT_931975 [Roridomyces roridus]
MVFHPYLPRYALWCTIERASWYHCDKLSNDLTGGKLEARRKLAGGMSLESLCDDPSMGVRLLLLKEQMKAEKPTASGMDSLAQMLAEKPHTSEAIISTYAAVVEFLLVERQQILQALSSTEARAESAERQVEEAEGKLVRHEKRTEATAARAAGAERKLKEAVEKLAELENSVHISSPSRIGIGPKHLELLFLGDSSEHSWHCRLCLTLITKPALLVAHAEQEHPTECSVLVAVSETQMDEARGRLACVPS